MGYFKLKLLRHPSLVLHIRALDCDHFLSARVKIWRSRTCASALFVLLQSICFIQRALQRSHCRLHCSRSQISLITWRESFVGRAWFILATSAWRCAQRTAPSLVLFLFLFWKACYLCFLPHAMDAFLNFYIIIHLIPQCLLNIL